MSALERLAIDNRFRSLHLPTISSAFQHSTRMGLDWSSRRSATSCVVPSEILGAIAGISSGPRGVYMGRMLTDGNGVWSGE